MFGFIIVITTVVIFTLATDYFLFLVALLIAVSAEGLIFQHAIGNRNKKISETCALIFIFSITTVVFSIMFPDRFLFLAALAIAIAIEGIIFKHLTRDGNEPPRPGPVKYNIRTKNQHFFPRKELEDIRSEFEKYETGCVIQAIAGKGGVGKTQLVAAYIHKFEDTYTDAICWLDVSESLITNVFDFLKEAGIVKDEDELKDEEIIDRLNKWFRNHTSFLFIFDNVENAEDIRPYISHIHSGHVLITTQDTHLDLKLHIANIIILPPFNEEEAREFMQRLFSTFSTRKIACPNETLDKLIEELGRVPLALVQAAAYITKTAPNCSCNLYLDSLEKYRSKMLDKPDDYEKSYPMIVKTSCKKLHDPALDLLYICAYMAPDKIPLDFLRQQRKALPPSLCDKLENKRTTIEVLGELTRFELIEQKDEEFVSIHRLVQMVLRVDLAEANDTQWISSCLTMAHKGFEYEYGNKTSMDAFTQNIPHILEIASHAQTMLPDPESQKKVADLFHRVGDASAHGGQYQKAIEWYEKALAIREKVFGKEHSNTAATYKYIARVYHYQGEYAKALEWHEKALAIHEKVFGKEHTETANTYDNIASVYSDQGEYAKAIEWYEKALAIFEKVLGKEHPSTATIYNNIAVVYSDKGEYAKALEWHEKALAIVEKVFGKEHPSTATTYNSIARFYYCQGEYSKAIEWHEKALAIFEKVLGKEHPSTATIYNNIAVVYSDKGEYSKALEWYEKALAIREKVLGKEHTYTATTDNNIAEVYKKQEKHQR